MNLKNQLKEYAREQGIELLGVTSSEDFRHYEGILQKRINEQRTTPFEEKEWARRLYPEQWLCGARSIIALALPYLPPDQKDAPHSHCLNNPRGYISYAARGIDYHLVLKEKIEMLLNFLKRQSTVSFSYCYFVDNGPPLERAVAARAGLGWSAANCSLLNPHFGSWVFLGEIIVDLDLEPDQPLGKSCQNCLRCLQSCPTGALIAPGKLDPRRCLSYWTQAKGYLPRDIRHFLGNRLYGCDTCQLACPVNQKAKRSSEAAFKSLFPEHGPALLPLLNMTNKEFQHTFGRTAAGWRGPKIIQRNAVVALGNSGNAAAVPPLLRLLREDPRPEIRGHAAWALGKLGTSYAWSSLNSSLIKENNLTVATEIKDALKTMEPKL